MDLEQTRNNKVLENGTNNNSVFIMIPFVLSSSTKMSRLVKEMLKTEVWEESTIKTKFLYKYVTQKLFGQNNKHKNCFVLEYKPCSVRVQNCKYALHRESIIYPSSSLGGRNCRTYNFVIDSVKLIAFSSNVGILAFNLHFLCKNADAAIISNSLYFLKKISSVSFGNKSDKSEKTTWLSLAHAMIDSALASAFFLDKPDFSYYSEEKYARANFFVCIKNIKVDTDYERELYYLKHGFTQKYDYVSASIDENYYAPNGRKWGISSEGCACLLTAEQEDVIEKQLGEFRGEYLLLYCLLLHQKYFYYKLLLQRGQSKGMTLRELKKYRSSLIDFESNFIFSTVTEVPQYQGVYDVLFSKLRLSNLYTDVEEPINNLNNNKNESNEKMISRLGVLISMLGLFSILADGHFVIKLFFGDCVAYYFVMIAIVISLIALFLYFCIKGIRRLLNK